MRSTTALYDIKDILQILFSYLNKNEIRKPLRPFLTPKPQQKYEPRIHEFVSNFLKSIYIFLPMR